MAGVIGGGDASAKHHIRIGIDQWPEHKAQKIAMSHHQPDHHPFSHHPSDHHPSSHHPSSHQRSSHPLQPPPSSPPPVQSAGWLVAGGWRGGAEAGGRRLAVGGGGCAPAKHLPAMTFLPLWFNCDFGVYCNCESSRPEVPERCTAALKH